MRSGQQPPREIVSLSDYRTRYASYRSDEALQALHASAALISIWGVQLGHTADSSCCMTMQRLSTHLEASHQAH